MKESKNHVIQSKVPYYPPSYIEVDGKFYNLPISEDQVVDAEELAEITTLKICVHHRYRVPLLWTFAFPGAEYWCPYCGHTHGMLGAGDSVPVTEELLDRRDAYEEFCADYLLAQASTYCHSMTIDDVEYKREDIPEKNLEIFALARKNWKYRIKL